MGQSRPLFVYFCSFLVTISIQIEKSIDGVLGIRTWGRRMVGADVTMELWRPPTLVDIIVTTLNGDQAISILRHINFAAWPAVELRCSILFQIWSNGKSNFDQHFDDPIDRSNDRSNVTPFLQYLYRGLFAKRGSILNPLILSVFVRCGFFEATKGWHFCRCSLLGRNMYYAVWLPLHVKITYELKTMKRINLSEKCR